MIATHNKPLCFPKQVYEDFGAPLNKLSIWRMKSRKKIISRTIECKKFIRKLITNMCHQKYKFWSFYGSTAIFVQSSECKPDEKKTDYKNKLDQSWKLLFWGFNPWREGGIVNVNSGPMIPKGNFGLELIFTKQKVKRLRGGGIFPF